MLNKIYSFFNRYPTILQILHMKGFLNVLFINEMGTILLFSQINHWINYCPFFSVSWAEAAFPERIPDSPKKWFLPTGLAFHHGLLGYVGSLTCYSIRSHCNRQCMLWANGNECRDELCYYVGSNFLQRVVRCTYIRPKICCFFENLAVNHFTFYCPLFCEQIFEWIANLVAYL